MDIALSTRESLASAGFRQAHQMFDLEEVAELRSLIGCQCRCLLAVDEFGHLGLCFFRWPEIDYALRRGAPGNEVNKFVVCNNHVRLRSHSTSDVEPMRQPTHPHASPAADWTHPSSARRSPPPR